MPKMRQLEDHELSTLENICLAAADRYKDDAELVGKLNLSERLVEQFERQSKIARSYASIFANFPVIKIEVLEDLLVDKALQEQAKPAPNQTTSERLARTIVDLAKQAK